MTAPGDWRVLQSLRAVAAQHALALDLRDDTHFFSTVREFAAHAQGRKQLRLEYWYRELRHKHAILMDGKEPVGGQWNFDADNRESFGKAGPQDVPAPTRFAPDATTQEVMALVNTQFANHPGSLQSFGWPVTRAQALWPCKPS
jgi:deoxyribodipyrimidine photolyase-related protein